MGPAERTIRNASVGDCFRESLSEVGSDGLVDVLGLYPNGCGNSGSDIRVVSRHLYMTGDAMPCGDDKWLRSGGEDPMVVLCYVPD